ncbi:hypothetical protein ACFPRL_18890 [Pseudoclavibacter helvolus]
MASAGWRIHVDGGRDRQTRPRCAATSFDTKAATHDTTEEVRTAR